MKSAMTKRIPQHLLPTTFWCLIGWVMVALAEPVVFAQGINPDYIRWWGAQQRDIHQERSTDTGQRAFLADGVSWKIALENGLLVPADETLFGFVPSLVDRSYLKEQGEEIRAAEPLPPRWDSRERGWLTNVKKQSPYGTCWAHAAMANLETLLRIREPSRYDSIDLPNLSENNLVRQSLYDPRPGKSLHNSGGFYSKAMAYLTRWAGPIDETQDPYPTQENAYKTENSNVRGNTLLHVQDIIMFSPKASPLGHDAIKRAVMEYGGVWVSYKADPAIKLKQNGMSFSLPFLAKDGKSFFNWWSYVFPDPEKKLFSNHAVLLVGWDDEYPAGNFACYTIPGDEALPVPPGNGAYLIKNSWGTSNGDDGYYWVSYYDSNMLYDESYVVPRIERTDNYGGIYEHDPLGSVYPFPYPEYSWGANVFTATNDDAIAAVGFYPQSPGTEYTIQIRTGLGSSGPEGGILVDAAGQSGVVEHAGYATIPLEVPVEVSKGERFAIILRLRSPNYATPFATETDIRMGGATVSDSSHAMAREGESFVSRDGTSWTDLTVLPNKTLDVYRWPNGLELRDVLYLTQKANLCIKAYTKKKGAGGAASVSRDSAFSESVGRETVAGGFPGTKISFGTPVPSIQAGEEAGLHDAPINPLYLDWIAQRDDHTAFPAHGDERVGGLLGKGNGSRALGYLPDLVDYSYLKNFRNGFQKGDSYTATSLPVRYDMRNGNRLTPVKNQNPYGTCWAHATLASLESALLTQKRGVFDFSEKHLANTHGRDNGFSEGGNGYLALAYLTRWSGPIDESQDPYPDATPFTRWKENGKRGKIIVPSSPRGTPLGHLQNATQLIPMETHSDTDEIKQAVLKHGGVYASYIDVNAARTADGCHYYWNGDERLLTKEDGGHAVLIVGWDDAHPRTAFKETPPVDGAFLVKNSWGRHAGDGGFFWVSYCDYTFGALELWAFHELEAVDNYGDVYCHDPLGRISQCGLGETTWGANEFIARQDDVVVAVGFYANVPETRYEIHVYTDCSDRNPVSGIRRTVQSGVADHCGYVTVPLSGEVSVRQGQRFSIVFKLTTPSYGQPLSYEAHFQFKDKNGKMVWTSMSNASASPGESFYSGDGRNWTDFTEYRPNGNLCFKAYTKARATVLGDEPRDNPAPVPGPGPTPAPQGIWKNLGGGAFKEATP